MKLSRMIYEIHIRNLAEFTDKFTCKREKNVYVIEIKKNDIMLTVVTPHPDHEPTFFLGTLEVKSNLIYYRLIRYSKKIFKQVLKEDKHSRYKAEKEGINNFLGDKHE